MDYEDILIVQFNKKLKLHNGNGLDSTILPRAIDLRPRTTLPTENISPIEKESQPSKKIYTRSSLNKLSYLMYYSKETTLHQVRQVLESGGDHQLFLQGHVGGNEIHSAVRKKRADIIQTLVEEGVDPFEPNKIGLSALLLARCGGDLASIRVLERAMCFFSATATVCRMDGDEATTRWMEVVPLYTESEPQQQGNMFYSIVIRAYEEALESEKIMILQDWALTKVSQSTNSFSLKNLTSGEIQKITVLNPRKRTFKEFKEFKEIYPQKRTFKELKEILEKHCGQKCIVATIITFLRKSLLRTHVILLLLAALFIFAIILLYSMDGSTLKERLLVPFGDVTIFSTGIIRERFFSRR